MVKYREIWEVVLLNSNWIYNVIENINKFYQHGELIGKNVLATIDFVKKYDPNAIIKSINEGVEDEFDLLLKILAENGYPPINLTLNNSIDLIDFGVLPSEERSNKIRIYINNLYTNDKIIKLIDSWYRIDWISDKRKEILSDALLAHIEGKYNLSIPAILPHLEGIIVEALEFNGKMRPGELKRLLESMLDQEESFDTALKSYYLENVLVGFEHGKEPESFLSRHSILHGNDVMYGSHENSLKLILLIDFTIEQLCDYRSNRS